MPVTSLLPGDARELIIYIKGSFDFKAHQDFRDAYEPFGPELRYSVDLKGVPYLDSSAFWRPGLSMRRLRFILSCREVGYFYYPMVCLTHVIVRSDCSA